MYKNEKLSTLNIKICVHYTKKLCSLNIEIKKFAYIEHTKSCVLFEKNKMYVEFETCVL